MLGPEDLIEQNRTRSPLVNTSLSELAYPSSFANNIPPCLPNPQWTGECSELGYRRGTRGEKFEMDYSQCIHGSVLCRSLVSPRIGRSRMILLTRSPLDGTIMVTMSAPIATSFSMLSFFSWLATAYLITAAATQLFGGKSTDIYSCRMGILVANVLFVQATWHVDWLRKRG